MDSATNETRIGEAFGSMTAALMKPYDIVDLLSTLLETCTGVLDVQAGGILIADAMGELELIASTSEESAVVETIVLAAGKGPCIDSYTSGVAVSVADIATGADAWPKFQTTALQQGLLSVHAVPMRIRDSVIGVMALLGTSTGSLGGPDATIAQSLADIATLGIVHERNFRKPQAITEQLHHVVNTRILIEQAKGALSQAGAITLTEAFTALRQYARTHGSTLHDISHRILTKEIPASEVVSALPAQ